MSSRPAAGAALFLALTWGAACGRAPAGGSSAEPMPSPEQWPQAVVAAAAGDPRAVEALLAGGVAAGRLLPLAAEQDAAEVVRMLLDRGADPHGFFASRALFVALDGGKGAAQAALAAAGADLDAPDELGLTLVHTAAVRGRTADLRHLLAAGADGDLATNTGRTALMSAAAAGRARAVEALLAASVEVGATDRDGWSALHYAAAAGESAIGLRLLAAEAPPDRASELGWAPLHLACRAGAGELVKALLAAGADPGATTRAAGSPLTLAARSGDLESVRALLAAGAEPGKTAAEAAAWWAERLGHDGVADLLGAPQ